MNALDSGQRLSARYTVRERLGTGVRGETWRAHDIAHDCEVVLKLLLPQFLASPEAESALRAELEAAARLDHPNVVGGYVLERDGAQLFLVREYIAGRDLASLRGQAWTSLVPAAAQIAAGLAAMHAQGLVHRDIKSSNVILTPAGAVKIIDLGIAAVAGDASAAADGSPYSASPQQLGGQPPAVTDDSYAFGVLLYELLSGYPPFYPNISRERVLREPAPPLKPVHPVPDALRELVMQLLEKNPQQRPGDLAAIAQTLHGLSADANGADVQTTAAASPATAEPSSPSAIVRPIMRLPADGRGARRGEAQPERQRQWVIGTALLVLVCVAIAVFVLLPGWARKAAPPPAPKPVAATVAQPAPPQAEVDLRALAADMDRAEQVRGVFDSLSRSLQERGATQWATQPFATARARGEQALKQFEAREFAAAQQSYQEALDLLQPVSDTAVRVLKEQLAKGAQALVAGQAIVAQQAFELAHKIDPENATAAKGLKRAASLDRVFALLASAGNDERGGQLQSAAGHFEAALKLDPDTTVARDGLTRVRNRIAADQFATLMSQGLRQIADGQLAAARATLERANGMHPGARAVTDALAQVAQAEQRRSIAAHRQQAEDFERGERWSDAANEYQAALKLDPSLEFARAGTVRVTPRVELARQFEILTGQPDRLLSPAVREQTRTLLATAGKIAAPGPVLRKQMEQVSTSLAQVEKPVRVALESDNQTEVVIHRFGKLGVFDHREVELTPGSYTVMGTRLGFRDVRRDLTILPGQTPPTLVVRCEDRI